MEFWRRKKKKENARKCFLENGSMFLEELIADCNGISNPIRMFSSDQISKATNHFDPNYSLPKSDKSWFTWYKGVIEGRSYAIKRYTELMPGEEELAYNDIALSARVSNHNGFLKLIGCCLEFPLPVLVFENPEYGVLNRRGSLGCEDAPLLPWNVRLKIAKEVAIAITYLHTAFPRIIIHRDIKPSKIFLDKNWKAKLTDFSSAVTLPEGKSWIEYDVMGTFGYIDPNYMETGLLTASSDVYSFGILMLVLVMGRPPLLFFDYNTLILDYVKDVQERGELVEFGGDPNDMQPDQMQMFLDLALRCCEDRNEDRPTMIMVAKEIKLIEKVSLDCYNSEILENGSDDGKLKQQDKQIVASEAWSSMWNGSEFVQKFIADPNNISKTPIRMFSSDQISKATNHFDPKSSLPELFTSRFRWYKGVIEGRPYMIKTFAREEEKSAYNDMALSARVNNHSGFHKLLGCCLEFPLPVLLFEDTEFRFLNARGSLGCEDGPLLPWNVRLKIAKEVATAITYLHTAFPRIIIHKDIKPSNVFLDKNWTAKLTEFSNAITLPEGESSTDEPVRGTFEYMEPMYAFTGLLTASSDVYSFGILMLVLLMGRPPILLGSDGKKDYTTRINYYVKDLQERGEPVEFGGDSNDMRPDQMKMFLQLALRCCEERSQDRPTMIMVAKEIKLIEKVSLDCYNSEILENGSDDSQI